MAKVYANHFARGVDPTATVPVEGARSPVRVCVRESRILGSQDMSRGGWIEGFQGHGASMLTAAEMRALAAALMAAADHLEPTAAADELAGVVAIVPE